MFCGAGVEMMTKDERGWKAYQDRLCGRRAEQKSSRQ